MLKVQPDVADKGMSALRRRCGRLLGYAALETIRSAFRLTNALWLTQYLFQAMTISKAYVSPHTMCTRECDLQ